LRLLIFTLRFLTLFRHLFLLLVSWVRLRPAIKITKIQAGRSALPTYAGLYGSTFFSGIFMLLMRLRFQPLP
jgi:hypothetical protein